MTTTAPRPARGLVTLRGHHFLADLLGPDSTVVDLGAHLGEFSRAVHDAYGCQSIAVEADPVLFERIAEGEGIRKVHRAIGAVDGPVTFARDANPESSHLASDGRAGIETLTVDGCTLETLRQQLGIARIDLLKLDVEGAEVQILASVDDSTLQEIPQITVEFHDFIEELRSRVAVEAAKTRLKKLGFACVVFSRSNNGDVLFVNRRHWQASALSWFYLEHGARYLRGARRMLARLLT